MTLPRVRTLVAEDEPLAREGLAEWVQSLPQLELVTTVPDGVAALAAIRELEPALVLMDIQMPGMTGLDVLRALASDGPAKAPAVIFTTAYDQHALAAFELHAVDYLMKPYSRDRFEEAVAHALQGLATSEQVLPALEAVARGTVEPMQRVLVRDQGKIFPLQVGAIEYLRSDTKYTAIASQGRSYLVRLPITSFEERLDKARFLKVNRSCIVNLDFVETMTPDAGSQLVVKMRDGMQVTASREVSRQLRADSI